MNSTIDLLFAHRSVRAFTAEPVPVEHLEAAIRAGQMASTSSAVQAYCVINITDPAVRRACAELAGNQRYVETSPLFLLFCADSHRHRLACQQEKKHYDARLEAFLVAAIDVSLFAQNVAVAFESLGYGICYIGGIRNDLPRLDAMLELPEGVSPLFGLCVGVPARLPSQRPRLPIGAVLMQDRYHDDDTMRAHMREYDTTYRTYLHQRGAPKSQVDAGWVSQMAKLHSTPRRPGVAAYFASKGASLE